MMLTGLKLMVGQMAPVGEKKDGEAGDQAVTYREHFWMNIIS